MSNYCDDCYELQHGSIKLCEYHAMVDEYIAALRAALYFAEEEYSFNPCVRVSHAISNLKAILAKAEPQP